MRLHGCLAAMGGGEGWHGRPDGVSMSVCTGGGIGIGRVGKPKKAPYKDKKAPL